jgi:hypothetical protein
MAAERPDRRTPRESPPLDRAAGPTGIAAVLPAAFVILLAVVIIALVLFGGWVGFGFALALLLVGVYVLSRYVQRVAWTRSSPERLRGGLSGMNEDLAVSDDVHEELSAHDLPPDSPARHEIVERATASGRRARSPSG